MRPSLTTLRSRADYVPSTEPSLLDQLALLSNPTPTEHDPENAYSSLTATKSLHRAPSEEREQPDLDDGAEGRAHYVDVG